MHMKKIILNAPTSTSINENDIFVAVDHLQDPNDSTLNKYVKSSIFRKAILVVAIMTTITNLVLSVYSRTNNGNNTTSWHSARRERY